MAKITMEQMAKISEISPNAEAELCRKAFELVANKLDWKGPVNAFVPVNETVYAPEVIAYAVEFMTATTCFVREEISKSGECGYRVSAMGYRKGPAGP